MRDGGPTQPAASVANLCSHVAREEGVAVPACMAVTGMRVEGGRGAGGGEREFSF